MFWVKPGDYTTFILWSEDEIFQKKFSRLIKLVFDFCRHQLVSENEYLCIFLKYYFDLTAGVEPGDKFIYHSLIQDSHWILVLIFLDSTRQNLKVISWFDLKKIQVK